ncbi:hypothetical protein M413DRAFT_61975 [Hebeloma cylindrosporum]|uniref:WD40 repeat-like protein n=1 Tax=Hebeloma cylindrosporum TaxID=76867 RepID=A0A0C3CWN4_HEBCY|nr:hypothetical protein M413DRAFT_61975 [Hebeloma cylindrosporum h7]
MSQLDLLGDDLDQEDYGSNDAPWYRDCSNDHPFNLSEKITVNKSDPPVSQSLAIFPWDEDSLSTLWEGSLHTTDHLEKWRTFISDFYGAVAVGSDRHLYVYFTNNQRPPLCVTLPHDTQTLLAVDKMCVAWALDHNNPSEPLIIFARGSLIYIYNIQRKFVTGYIRGHGGAITSISVHPTSTHLFCSTSRDYTTRIYDLTLEAQKVPNPHWLPIKRPSLAGAAHGLRLPFSEREGYGIGRCICVLQGGRSGGHQAAVLASVGAGEFCSIQAFHPRLPIIATSGLDRQVKIWPVRYASSPEEIKREDKPLFSSGRVHKARVLSISWLQEDLLLTHSAPALMRVHPDDPVNKETYLEAGELIIWRWLGLDRFFPVEHEDLQPRSRLYRGISADYQESSSFKIISIHSFPTTPSQHIVPNLSLFQTPEHDPLIFFVYPGARSFSFTNASLMSPREHPPIPAAVAKLKKKPPQDDEDGTDLAEAAERMNISGGNAGEDNEPQPSTGVKNTRPPDFVPPPIIGWGIALRDPEDSEEKLMNCAMGCNGEVIVGVGSKGSVWVWGRGDD